jgi:hypothetical protein
MFWTKIKLAAISAFIVLNLGTVLFMNRPMPVVQATDNFLSKLSPLTAYHFSYTGWLMAEYAHKCGLDNRWEMFVRQSRENWWFTIKAKTDVATIELPLPRQSPRTFWQRNFFDFREGKFHLNLYENSFLRQAYASYLGRKYSVPGQPPIRSIIFELHTQNLLSRADAAKYGRSTEPQSYTQILDEFPCSP